MPLTAKGRKILASMKKEYGGKKGKEVFYASQNKGTIKGTHEKQAAVAQETAAIKVAYFAGFGARCMAAGVDPAVLMKRMRVNGG